jgi:hypothetical protein
MFLLNKIKMMRCWNPRGSVDARRPLPGGCGGGGKRSRQIANRRRWQTTVVQVALLSVAQTAAAENTTLGEFIRAAVFGEKGHYDGVQRVPRGTTNAPRGEQSAYVTKALVLEKRPSLASSAAWARLRGLEISEDGLVAASTEREYCYTGGCCGWGHRLLRQAKTFSHVHFVDNRTMIMEWGPCPNSNGKQGSGKTR